MVCFILQALFSQNQIRTTEKCFKIGYGINYKYKGMLAHSFGRCYVVTKFILPMMDDLKLSPIKYDKECNYLHNLDDKDNK